MNSAVISSLPALMIWWLATAGAAVVVFIALLAYRRRERNIPLATTFENLQDQAQELQAQKSDAQRVIAEGAQAARDRDVAAEEVRQSKAELERLAPERQEQERIRSELVALEQRRNETRQTNQQLDQQESQLRTSVVSLSQQQEERKTALLGLAHEVERMTTEQAEVKRSIAASNLLLDRTRHDLTTEADLVNAKRAERSAAEAAIAEAQARETAIRQQIADYEVQATTLARTVAEHQASLDVLSREREEARTQRLHNQREHEAITLDIARLTQELSVLKGDCEGQRQLSLELTAEVATKQSDVATLAASIAGAQQQLQSIEHEVERGRGVAAALTMEIETAQALRAEIGRETELARSAIAHATEDLTLVTKEVASQRTRLEQLTTEVAAQQSEKSKLLAEIAGGEQRVADLKLAKKTLEDQIHELDLRRAGLLKGSPNDGPDAMDRYKDLWENLKFADLKPAIKPLDERQALERTGKLLKMNGLQFSDRVLHAYHTALKTSQDAPITVLAGISGTGKSALPRRYAEGMGMHFVPLAVQPRWDSPQDLFGFFNHIEGRFKASDLARALVQFERHNRKNWNLPEKWNHGREDRMCLVLLDEMNLARIEYYFSEFLSKLETRRDIKDPSDQARRKDAEISIDMGSLGDNEKAIAFYPDLNVLYTGTMNEDESTQSLSDKVIDRACVLRFGRPHELDPSKRPTAKRDHPDAKPVQEGLAMDTWSDWKKPLTASDHSTFMSWIDDLNEALDKVRRPFAHRAAMSMLAYAGNYPGWVTDRLRLAMADQIEQRILPRLRGLDTSEHKTALDEIGKVIEATGDSVLKDAYKRSTDSAQGTFLWAGVDRAVGQL